MERIELLDETERYPHAEALVEVLAALLDDLGLTDREMTVVLMDDESIARHNLADRGEQGPTDVLSYPTAEPGDEGFPQIPHLGDVFISLDTAARQAALHGHSLHDEVLVLAAHALTHLQGFDHQADHDWQPFLAAQARVLELAAEVAVE